MFLLFSHVRRAARWGQPGALALLLATLAGGCAQNPLDTPVSWWHDLQGGTIAATRPPPPGADLPYPSLGPMPEKPALPDKAARSALLDQLATERDRAQRNAARNPIVVIPPPAPPPPPKPAAADDQTANASLPGAEPPPAAPPPKAAATPGPTGPVLMAGEGVDASGLPPIPDKPPAPASFEGLAPEPMPTPLPPAAAHTGALPSGPRILFATGQASFVPSQLPSVKDVAAHRHGHPIEIVGLGEAVSDTPEGQAAALALGLKRAQTVAAVLISQHVPETALRLSAEAFGRGAVLRIVP